jgi:hypothetical protein
MMVASLAPLGFWQLLIRQAEIISQTWREPSASRKPEAAAKAAAKSGSGQIPSSDERCRSLRK